MYQIEYSRGVAKDLKFLPKVFQKEVLDIIEKELVKNPFLGKPLKGPFAGLYKLRVQDYRIIYSIVRARLVILVLRIRHRKDVYRGLIY